MVKLLKCPLMLLIKPPNLLLEHLRRRLQPPLDHLLRLLLGLLPRIPQLYLLTPLHVLDLPEQLFFFCFEQLDGWVFCLLLYAVVFSVFFLVFLHYLIFVAFIFLLYGLLLICFSYEGFISTNRRQLNYPLPRYRLWPPSRRRFIPRPPHIPPVFLVMWLIQVTVVFIFVEIRVTIHLQMLFFLHIPPYFVMGYLVISDFSVYFEVVILHRMQLSFNLQIHLLKIRALEQTQPICHLLLEQRFHLVHIGVLWQ